MSWHKEEEASQDRVDNQGLSGVFIGLGVLLIVLGALFHLGQAAGFDLGRIGWPFLVIIPGLAVSGVGLAVGSPTGERMTPLGAAVTMVGLILLYQNTADHFESWAYAWVLVFPTSTGLGRMVYGSLKGTKAMVETGGRSALIGAALFVVGAFFFEVVVGGFGLGLGRYGWPLGLVIVGMALLFGGLLPLRHRHLAVKRPARVDGGTRRRPRPAGLRAVPTGGFGRGGTTGACGWRVDRLQSLAGRHWSSGIPGDATCRAS